MAGNLYQLRSNHKLRRGDSVQVNGPYDKFGIVINPDASEDRKNGYLNMIRGTGQSLSSTSGIITCKWG